MRHYRLSPAGEILSEESDFPQGSGVFTTFVAQADQPVFALQAHYERLTRDCAFFQIAFPWENGHAFADAVEQLKSQLATTVEVLRIAIIPETASCQSPPVPSQLWVSVRPVPETPASLILSTVSYERVFPVHKHLLPGREQELLAEVQTQGAHDYLRLTQEGWISEASYANVFWIVDETHLATPDPQAAGCLPGVMRQAIIRAAHAEGFFVEESTYPIQALKDAQGIFLTNAVRGLMPVEQVDNQCYSLEITSALTKRLSAHLNEAF